MKKLLVLSGLAGIMFIGCADKPIATSVVELAGNQKVIGWGNENKVQKSKIIIKKIYFSPKPKLTDSDGDGVLDYMDKCPNTPKNLIVDHEGCPIITTLRLNFDFNSAKVKKIYYPEIEKIAEILKANPKLKIEIAGYTDNIGSKVYNKKLSLKRAEAVKNILVKVFGINPKRIIVKGFGEDYPLVPNTTSTNRALNRRVEIVDITSYKTFDNTKNINIKSINTKLNKILKNDKNKSTSKPQKLPPKTKKTKIVKHSKVNIIIPPIF